MDVREPKQAAVHLCYLRHGCQDPLAPASGVASVVHAMEAEPPVSLRTLALILAAVGVYGVMAYSVKERTQEIGVRMALASSASVCRMVLGQALHIVLSGIATGLLGVGGAHPLARGIAS